MKNRNYLNFPKISKITQYAKKFFSEDTTNKALKSIKPKDISKSPDLNNDSLINTDIYNKNLHLSPFKESFLSFSYKNNLNYNQIIKNKGDELFFTAGVKMVHYLDDHNINDYKEGIKENKYEFYDIYKNLPEILFLGRSNVGKSSLINALFGKEITSSSKTPGKTQKLEFYIFGREERDKLSKRGDRRSDAHIPRNSSGKKIIYSHTKMVERLNPVGMLVDAPGFGWVDGPVKLKKKFKYLIYTYLNYAVRLQQIVYLINGEYGMTNIDKEEITFLNNFNKDIQLVFTKVDSLTDSNLIKYVTEASNFTRSLKNVRTEILMTSSKTKYGMSNLRTHLFMDITPEKIPKSTQRAKINIPLLEENIIDDAQITEEITPEVTEEKSQIVDDDSESLITNKV